MEEVIKETAAAVEETAEVKAEEKKAEKGTKPDKLKVLQEKYQKAAAAVEKAAKKEKAIREEIAAEEQKRRDKEIKQLDTICKNMKIDLTDVISLIKLISENGLTVSEAAELIGAK
ncbi:MAG: hypothetical protein NC253_00715 [Ruminococcus sp.]|nr:hypothetical protein [Ruminococcus sp.]MCM1381067.1 hypothetical protein [Muribaculaceae bacterium]MCM1478578.1 hypothetical protein [Muribaculaceae bacterium]